MGSIFTAKISLSARRAINALGHWLIKAARVGNEFVTEPKSTDTPVPPDIAPTSPSSRHPKFRWSPRSELGVELLTVAQILTVLERQLTEVTEDVELSVVGVCQGFQGMAKRAESAVNAAEESVSGSGDGEDVVADMQIVLGVLIQNIHSSCEFSNTVSSRLSQLESRLGSIESTMTDIEDLARKAKMVALNGQIEAARLGEAGRAFAVVAQETKQLAAHAAETSTSIRDRVVELVEDIRATSAQLKQRATDDTQRFQESQSRSTDLLQAIDENQKRMTNSLSKTGEISSELRNDIARAVMSLQFQDRVSQRIGHVIETLELLVGRANTMVDPRCEPAARQRSSEILDEISSRYTMDSERLAQGEWDAVGVAAGSSEASFDVELF